MCQEGVIDEPEEEDDVVFSTHSILSTSTIHGSERIISSDICALR